MKLIIKLGSFVFVKHDNGDHGCKMRFQIHPSAGFSNAKVAAAVDGWFGNKVNSIYMVKCFSVMIQGLLSSHHLHFTTYRSGKMQGYHDDGHRLI